ncbi:MAG: hypothetical protein ACOZDY_00800 [Pseudomonadota bacterium]
MRNAPLSPFCSWYCAGRTSTQHPSARSSSISRSRCGDDPFSLHPGYFEADLAKNNAFREELAGKPYRVTGDGTVRPLERPGIGLDVDEAFIRARPVIEGPGYV